jgi:multiple sugar transport system permease protein
VLFLLVLAMMMVPVQVRIIPMYLITMYLGLLDTYAALIVPGIFNAFAIFLLRQFFLTLPRDMDEAAVIDGANHIQILTKVIVPLSRAVFSALTVFIFLGAWNSLLWPLIATSSESMRVVAVGLTSFGDLYGTDWPLLMTGSILVVMPTIIMYLINQQFITRGIVMTGIKG